MSDYTPRTHEVREGWVYYCYEAFWLMKNRRTDYREQFDRWLEAHDAEVRADEREKAAQRVAAVRSPNPLAVMLGGKPFPLFVDVDDAVAAARGDGEQNA